MRKILFNSLRMEGADRRLTWFKGELDIMTMVHKIGNISKENCVSHSVVSDSLRSHGLYSPWNSPGQNTGVGSPSLLQGISRPRDWIQVSRTAGRFLTVWATREGLNREENCKKNQMEIWTCLNKEKKQSVTLNTDWQRLCNERENRMLF